MNRSPLRRIALGLALAAACLAASPAAAQFDDNFGKNKVQYREFDWQIYHSPHFDMYYYTAEEALLQKVVSFAESSYDRISRDLNHQIKEPIPLIFYATHSAFEQNNIILNFIPENVGAFATPARFRMVLPVDLPDPELIELISHELTHIFQYHILFQGSLAKAVASAPPTWFMEGMASYVAKDESPRDKMFIRDAVVNDNIPSVTQTDFGGFFAYRFGHSVFDFVEERWGKEGFLDLLYEVRNTLGFRIDRAVKRTFRMEPEDFDSEFRRWLRRKYLPELIRTGEPGDFGRIFRVKDEGRTYETSPAASPSGDLVAAVSTLRGDTDVVLFDARKRILLRNLTKGFSNEYQYLAAQEQQLGRQSGRDLTFSPDGNYLAIFAKRERGRSLLLIDVLNGGVKRIVDMEDVEQQLAPAWSPDGKHIAFAGNRNGQFDVFILDVDTLEITNLTQDEIYDGAPAYSPDGRSLVFVSVVGEEGASKIFRIDLDNPKARTQITTGGSNENDPIYSPDAKRLYFTSDREGGVENIFSLDLANGDLRQHTNVVTGAFMPTILKEPSGKERLVYTAYWKGVFDLYVSDLEETIGEVKKVELPAGTALAQNLPRFEPDIQVTLDDANKEKHKGFKFFLEDAQSLVGVNTDQTVQGQVLLTFSDYLGDRRILALLSAVESFSNFDITYADLSKRLQWQVNVFDNRTFFVVNDTFGRAERVRSIFQQTGAIGSLVYPLSFYTRAEVGAGYIVRKIDIPFLGVDPETGEQILLTESRDDDFPIAVASMTGDSALFAPWGAITGRRWKLAADYAPDLDGSGTLSSHLTLDVRQYVPVTRRSNLAFRAFAGAAEGNFANPIFFGGLDTLRGFGFRELVGDRAFFANAEFRFPLIDQLAIGIGGIRGVLFFDIGGAYFRDFEEFDFYDSEESRLEDAVASYGWGVSVRLFGGVDLNWDFAKQFDLKDSEGGFKTAFWIGQRF